MNVNQKNGNYKRKGIYILLTFLFIILVFTFTVGRDYYLGKPPNLVYFSVIHFAGYLFFLIMPVELIFLLFISGEGNLTLVFFIAIITALSAQFIDYLSGYLFSDKIILLFDNKKKYRRSVKQIRKYGNYIIFLFNLLPLSSPILVLAAGMIKYPVKQVFLYSFLGLLFKYTILLLFFV
jgi:membrane protein DedA with SNARE-associated domain